MSDEKKTFFASLEPKSALLVGLVAGALVIGTVGFIVMLVVYLGGRSTKADTSDAATNNQPQQPATEQQTLTPSVTKSDKPVVELFIMSYCPYGLQMQKAYSPVMKLLGGKADISVKFVAYAMHGQKELEENTRQYCIANEQKDKYLAYVDCFTTSGDYQACMGSTGVSESKLNTCVDKTNKSFGTMDKFKDQSTWLSGQYPVYPVHQSLNDKYGVQGSPTLVVNGAQVEAGRSPEAIKQVVCASFNNPPSECSQTLSSAQASPGFGAGTTSGNTAAAECGS